MADTPSPPAYVVCAASAADAMAWAKEQGLTQRQINYASSASRIDGLTHFTVVRLPGYYQRADADQIDAVIRRNQRKQCGHG